MEYLDIYDENACKTGKTIIRGTPVRQGEYSMAVHLYIYNAKGGTHLTGFKTTYTTLMNTYARELGILKEKDSNFTGADIRNGLTAVISIKHPAPRFEGQTKTKLDNQDAAKAAGKVTAEKVQLYFDRNL